MQSKARLLATVPVNRYWLVFRLGVFAAFVPLLMRLPLAQSRKLLVPSSSPAVGRLFAQRGKRQWSADEPAVREYVLYTETALRLGRPITQNRCLTRCVTLYYFLSRQGLDLTIVFGAGTLDGRFSAHCWLEVAGKPFAENENPYAVYSPTYCIPDSAITGLGYP